MTAQPEIFEPGHQLMEHPLCRLVPEMSQAELAELRADIELHGQREPIVLYDAHILDGRSRYVALRDLGLTISYVTFEGNEEAATAFVKSLNIHRRHLTQDQKRIAISRLLKQDPTKSDRAVATIADVSPTTVGAVRSELSSSGQLPNVDQTVGRDGKARSRPKGRRNVVVEPTHKLPAAPPWSRTEQLSHNAKEANARLLAHIENRKPAPGWAPPSHHGARYPETRRGFVRQAVVTQQGARAAPKTRFAVQSVPENRLKCDRRPADEEVEAHAGASGKFSEGTRSNGQHISGSRARRHQSDASL
jgi:ParB-like chromosome segregation protein Spo0J